MNNNLSASPTWDDIGQQIEDSDTNQPEPTITWHCPYCNHTDTELSEVRDHITRSIENEHQGVSGRSPDKNIIGTNPDGETVQQIEGIDSRPDEDHHLERGEKKKLIVNAWLANDRNRDIQAFSNILPVSEQYVQRITKQLETGELDDEVNQHLDWDVRNELGERLETYYETNEPEMSLTTSDTDDDELEHGTKKQQIVNAWLLDKDLNYPDLDDVLPAHREYIGKIFRQLNDGDISTEEIEAAANRDFQTELIGELKNNDVAVNTVPTTDAPTIDDTEPGESDEGEATQEYERTLADARKKDRILNSVLLERDLDISLTNSDIASAANSSTQYAQKLSKQVKDGDVLAGVSTDASPDEIREKLRAIGSGNRELEDDELDDAMREELEEDLETARNLVISPEELDEASDESLQDALRQFYEAEGIVAPDTDDGTVDIDLSNGDDPFENVPVSKRKAIINVIDAGLGLSNPEVGQLTGASGQYARKTRNEVQDGKYDPNEFVDERIQNALEQLDEEELDAFFADDEDTDDVETTITADEPSEQSSDETTEPETDPDTTTKSTDTTESTTTTESTEPTSTTDTTDSIDATDGTDSTDTQNDTDVVSAADIENVRDTVDTLYRQAQYEGDGQNKKAEFVAKEIRDRLDTLLEQTN
jgi:hypothetical protein